MSAAATSLEAGRVTDVDREAVLAEIKERLEQSDTAAEAEARAMVQSIQPHLEAFHRAHSPTQGHRPYRFNAMIDG